MSLLVTFTEKVRGLTDKEKDAMNPSVEINVEKILSVKSFNGKASSIKVDSGNGVQRYTVLEDVETIKDRIENAEIERAVAIHRAAATIGSP